MPDGESRIFPALVTRSLHDNKGLIDQLDVDFLKGFKQWLLDSLKAWFADLERQAQVVDESPTAHREAETAKAHRG